MERYSARTIDEAGRIVFHSELRKKLCMEADSKIALTRVDTIIILQCIQGDSEPDEVCAVCQVDELGRITLPAELRQAMGWNVKASVALYHTDNLMILKSAG